MGPEAMVATSDTEASEEVVDDRPDGGLELEGDVGNSKETICRDEDHKGGGEPVDVLVPVLERDRLLADVDFGFGFGSRRHCERPSQAVSEFKSAPVQSLPTKNV